MPIVWVAFSGRSDLTATLVGSFVSCFGFQTITVYSQQAALVLMGAPPARHRDAGAAGLCARVSASLFADRWSARRQRGASPALADASRLQPDET
jgi:branched-chain amino acid transport system permease protein